VHLPFVGETPLSPAVIQSHPNALIWLTMDYDYQSNRRLTIDYYHEPLWDLKNQQDKLKETNKVKKDL